MTIMDDANQKPSATLAPVDATSAQAGIMTGTDGDKPSLVWARYNGAPGLTAGYLGGWQPYSVSCKRSFRA